MLWAVGLAGCGSADGSGPAPTPAPAAFCGDGRVQAGEECDDANTNDGDGCLRTCFAPVTWAAGDPHIHSIGCNADDLTPAQLLHVSMEREMKVTAGLVWGDGFDTDRHYFTGSDDGASQPGAIIHYDLEVSHFPAATPGHLVILGLHSLNFSNDPFHRPGSGIPVADWALGQNAVVGMAHGQFWPDDGSFPSDVTSCCMPWDFPVQAIRGKLSFLETEQKIGGPPVDPGTELLWTKTLNAGARVGIAGASDYPCIHHFIGSTTPRTDVLVDGEVSYEKWIEGLRAGRSTIGTGAPTRHLNLRVNGQPLGSEVRVRAGTKLRLSLESESGSATTIRTIVNGAVVDSVNVEAGLQAAPLELEIQKSSWISAATSGLQTSPIYVVVDDAPIRASASDTCYLIRYVDHLINLVNRGKLVLGDEKSSSLRTYQEAKAELQTRFADAGGATCP
jgi:cysteine-rich repeat protein